MNAIALLSSGLDSSVALALARAGGTEVRFALTYDYGQRSAERELSAARRIAEFLGIPHRPLSLPWFREMKNAGGLVGADRPLPQPTVANLSERDFSETSAKAVWVPNRNGVFLEVAASLAESEGANALIVGFNQEEAETFPDNSEGYREAINRALRYSTANHVEVVSPTIGMDKREIVAQALRLAFPLDLLWSCYEAGSRMCGRCESCMRLKRALNENEVRLEGLFDHPSLGE